jgi:hypothetical protein
VESNKIKIGEVEILIRAGEEFSFEGLFSNKTLAGINLKLENVDRYYQKRIEDLLKEKEVDVYDPFAAREYSAEISQRSNSYTVGSEVKTYELTVKEIDKIPYFEEIEINGNIFNVLSYQESIISDTVSRQGVLKLTSEEFNKFRKLLSESSISVKRVGVDEEPFNMRFGSQMFWSKHKEDEGEYFKHIFRLFDKSVKPGKLDFASGIIQGNAANMLISLSSKFEELLEALKSDNSLADDTKDKLQTLSRDSIPSKELINNLYDNLVKVMDAEEHLK